MQQSAAQFNEPITLSVLMPVYNERFLVAASVQRVLSFSNPRVRRIELIIVNDRSTDGTTEILRSLASRHPEIRLIEHQKNQGKGGAIRTAIQAATGELSVIQDADLEYFPDDWGGMLRPFFESNADAVYGSRLLISEYRRVQRFWHSLGNSFLTLLSNMMTDLNLTDMETCYKMVRTELLKSIPVRSNDFRLEPELTAKLAKRGAVIYEVPIRYAGRTYQEGKKIGVRDGMQALWAILKWSFIDDLYNADEYGSAMLTSFNHIQKFSAWTADFISPDVGSRVLEIGAGIGNLTLRILPRQAYTASDINPHYLAYLRNLAVGKPYLQIRQLDLSRSEDFRGLEGAFDTVICLNVLEHIKNDLEGLRNIHAALEPGGTAIVLVPQGQHLYGTLDTVLGHEKRYGSPEIAGLMQQAGFTDVRTRDFNRAGVPGWLLNGRLLKRDYFPRVQLKLYNTLTPAILRLDHLLPWSGLSLVATGKKPL